jgi:hypothetical protein
MKVHELMNFLLHQSGDAEVRIGSSFEDGPYSHTAIGGIHRSGKGNDVILTGGDESWCDEGPEDLEVLWPDGK